MSNVDSRKNSDLILRMLPKMDRLLGSEHFRPLLEEHSREEVLLSTRRVLEELRCGAAGLSATEVEIGAIQKRVEAELLRRAQFFYRQVVNATGVILHTGLGRATLPREAVQAVAQLSSYSQRLEINLESGQRGGRDEGCARLLREMTGCEAATVVNNNAAATLLILAAIARGKRVVLSRGELVEIGGAFRIPDVMSESGAVLSEVGTTNRTHLRDYQSAIDSETGMILKVHTSNYLVQGFTCEVGIEELVRLGREHRVPVVHDLGSGCAVDLAAYGIFGEPLLRESVRAGADLICFSGDKLLGGPQAGIILGRKEAVERCRQHPLFRAMRPGRLIYTALEATLRIYIGSGRMAVERIPVLQRLTASPANLRQRAQRLARRLRDIPGFAISVVRCMSQAGSGSLPAREFPSWGVSVESIRKPADAVALELRTGDPAILPRVQGGAVLLDVRTLDDREFALIEARFRQIS